ncbi:hypothetical protein LCGC14_2992540 [marine sediment metagenome]|uniref:Uncharacterized protein n=1 Tax=marine sediment metagenome TaxID=412755 RepID=A0A0F8X3Y6_9ZZZZ
MVIKTIAKIKCDSCGKDTETETERRAVGGFGMFSEEISAKVPEGWYFLEKIHVKGFEAGKKKNELYICEDPQFCCKDCLIEYLEEKLKKVK